MRSNARASEWVVARTFCRSCSVSRSSRLYRSAHRACASRSAQPWQGWARSARRRVASSGSSAADPPPERRRAGDGRVDAGFAQRGREVAAHAGHPVVDALGQPHPAQRRDGHGEVGGGQPPGPAVLGEHQRARVGVAREPRVEHDGEARPPSDRHGDDVAGLELAQRGGGGVAAVGDPLAGQRLLPLGHAPAQCGVLGEVAEVAAHRGRVARRGSPRCARCAGPARRRSGRPGTGRTTAPAAPAPLRRRACRPG